MAWDEKIEVVMTVVLARHGMRDQRGFNPRAACKASD
jgi:hypothetical protein